MTDDKYYVIRCVLDGKLTRIFAHPLDKRQVLKYVKTFDSCAWAESTTLEGTKAHVRDQHERDRVDSILACVFPDE